MARFDRPDTAEMKMVAVVLDVDLAVALGADLLDDLAALADDLPDLVGGIFMLNILGAYG